MTNYLIDKTIVNLCTVKIISNDEKYKWNRQQPADLMCVYHDFCISRHDVDSILHAFTFMYSEHPEYFEMAPYKERSEQYETLQWLLTTVDLFECDTIVSTDISLCSFNGQYNFKV